MFIGLVFGLFMVGSASSLKAFMKKGNSFYFFWRQFIFIIIGLVCFFIIIKNKINKWNIFIYLFSFGVVGALIYVLLKGEVSNGIKGWINIFGFGIQPSEFAKTATILFLAITQEKLMKQKNLKDWVRLVPFLLVFIYALLILAQPDFGTMVILLGIAGVIFLVIPFDVKFKRLIVFCTSFLVLVLGIMFIFKPSMMKDFQKDRLNFKDPCSRYKERSGYQLCNSLIAINGGGVLGKHFGNSTQKFLYLPEAHTDFIFPIMIEECGLLCGIAVMIGYFIIIWRILAIGRRSYNLQGAIICYGVATYISLHIILNLGGVMGLFPLTGVPLPFFSYGGSFMINLLICLGFVERVAIENVTFEQKHLVR